jgi:hypothetical protein
MAPRRQTGRTLSVLGLVALAGWLPTSVARSQAVSAPETSPGAVDCRPEGPAGPVGAPHGNARPTPVVVKRDCRRPICDPCMMPHFGYFPTTWCVMPPVDPLPCRWPTAAPVGPALPASPAPTVPAVPAADPGQKQPVELPGAVGVLGFLEVEPEGAGDAPTPGGVAPGGQAPRRWPPWRPVWPGLGASPNWR